MSRVDFLRRFVVGGVDHRQGEAPERVLVEQKGGNHGGSLGRKRCRGEEVRRVRGANPIRYAINPLAVGVVAIGAAVVLLACSFPPPKCGPPA
jgi:hypothetical protein